MTQQPGDEQDLDIEAEPLQLQPREDLARGFALKQLEAALRVTEFESCHQTHHHVEEAAGVFAQRGLVHANQRSIDRARSDRHLRGITLRGFDQLLDLLDR